jgi:hypothetical protein
MKKSNGSTGVRRVHPPKPSIHPNHFPGMKRLEDLICDPPPELSVEERLEQMETEFDNLWTALDNYMGNPRIDSLENAFKNLDYLRAVAKENVHQLRALCSLQCDMYASCTEPKKIA